MRTICLYFEIHQIIHLKRYRFFDIGTNHYYYDDYANETSINEVAERSYIPAFLYMVSSVPTFGTRDTNAWYERYHPLKFVVPMPSTSPTKGGIKLIPVRHRIQKGSPLHFNKAQRTSHIISSQTLFFGRLRSSLL